MQWSFTLTAPLATLKSTIGRLLSAEAALSKQKLGIGLSFSTGALQTSPQAQPACSQAALIVDATAEAQALAGSAGVSMGSVTAISAVGATVGDVFTVPTLVSRIGTFSYVPTTCPMLAQFRSTDYFTVIRRE